MKSLFKKITTFTLLGSASITAIAAVSCGAASGVEHNKAPNVGMVTDGGVIFDKSFNEQAAKALMQIKGIKDLPSRSIIQSVDAESQKVNNIIKSYSEIESRGIDTIVAPGFGHVDAITKWNETHNASEEKFILVDGEVEATNVASVVFDAKQPAFLAGYIAARYLAFKYNNPDERLLGLFGGAKYDSVKDIMAAYVMGVEYWNEHCEPGRNVKFVSFDTHTVNANDYDGSYFQWGFEPNAGLAPAQELISKGAKVILPVAGAAIKGVLDAIDSRPDISNDVRVIGVDVDQSKTYPEDSNKFITSILKNVKEAIVKVYYDGDADYGQTVVGMLDNDLVGLSTIANTGIEADLQSSIDSSSDAYKHITLSHEISSNISWDDAFDYINQHKVGSSQDLDQHEEAQ